MAAEEDDGCDPPAPKKIKKSKKEAASESFESTDLNGNLEEVKNALSSDELMNSASDQSSQVSSEHSPLSQQGFVLSV